MRSTVCPSRLFPTISRRIRNSPSGQKPSATLAAIAGPNSTGCVIWSRRGRSERAQMVRLGTAGLYHLGEPHSMGRTSLLLRGIALSENVDQVARDMAHKAQDSIRRHRRQCAGMWAAYFFLLLAAITFGVIVR